MGRKQSILAPDWWDFTTLDDEILNDAAGLTRVLWKQADTFRVRREAPEVTSRGKFRSLKIGPKGVR